MKGRIMKSLAAAVLAGIALHGGGVLLAEDKAIALGDFSSDVAGWDFYLGKEFPGAQGNFYHEEKDGVEGKGAACLDGDFSGGGCYVCMSKSFSPVEFKGLSFYVKSNDVSAVVVRIVDSTGQTHQQKIALKDTGDWQKVSISDPTGGAKRMVFFSGANDGQWHDPAKAVSILLDKQGLKKEREGKGSMLVDKVELKTSAAK